MTLSSMTGYARAADCDDGFSWVWEIKSVNGKALDIRMRIPSGWERLDPIVRGAVQKKLKRGNFSISLEIRSLVKEQALHVNAAFLDELVSLCKARDETPDINQLLSVRGVVEVSDEKPDTSGDDARIANIKKTLETALDALVSNRQEEGAKIADVVKARVDEIEKLVAEAENLSAIQPAALSERMKTQLDEILEPSRQITEDRLAQEVAILVTKADIREELDRLVAHVSAARDLLKSKDAIGRKMDFLCQEFNRETNTLCSKSSDIELTKIGLALKSAIDQFREQSANIE